MGGRVPAWVFEVPCTFFLGWFFPLMIYDFGLCPCLKKEKGEGMQQPLWPFPQWDNNRGFSIEPLTMVGMLAIPPPFPGGGKCIEYDET